MMAESLMAATNPHCRCSQKDVVNSWWILRSFGLQSPPGAKPVAEQSRRNSL